MTRFLMTSRSARRRGLTLTEMAIVLGAMAIVMTGIWQVVSNVWDSYRFRKMNEEMVTVVSNIRDHFGPKGCIRFGAACSGAADITAAIDNDAFRLIPVSMRDGAGNIRHAMSTAAGNTFQVNAISGTVFRITLSNLKKSACTKLLMDFPIMMPEMGVVRLQTGGQTYDPIDPRNPAGMPADFPFQLDRANALCTDNGEANVVSYDFRLFP